MQANAKSLADEAEAHFGDRPLVAANLEDLSSWDVQAVDITTTPRYHHSLAIEALERGWHVMVEKPMGLTVRACHLIQKTAQTRLHEPIRRNPAASGGTTPSNPAGVYGRWQREMPAEFTATAEDASYATLAFKNGVVGQYVGCLPFSILLAKSV